MNYSPADILRWYLLAKDPPLVARPSELRGSTPPDVNNAPAWPCFVGRINTDGNYAIVIRDTIGYDDGRSMRTGVKEVKPGVQLRIRSMDYPSGFDKGTQIIDVLDRTMKTTVLVGEDKTSYTLLNCSRKGNLIYLGQEEEKQREIFVVNYVLTIVGIF